MVLTNMLHVNSSVAQISEAVRNSCACHHQSGAWDVFVAGGCMGALQSVPQVIHLMQMLL